MLRYSLRLLSLSLSPPLLLSSFSLSFPLSLSLSLRERLSACKYASCSKCSLFLSLSLSQDRIYYLRGGPRGIICLTSASLTLSSTKLSVFSLSNFLFPLFLSFFWFSSFSYDLYLPLDLFKTLLTFSFT